MPLKIVKRSRSPYWILRGSVRGYRVEESTGTADKKLAEEIRAKREAEILKEQVYGKQATATFAHAAASYLEQGGDARFLAPVLDYFGTTLLLKIDQEALDRGAKATYPDASASTRNRQFYTPASAVLHHAAKRQWCPKPVIERPKQPKGRIRWLEPEQANALIAACAPHMKPLVTFLFYTGARLSEALYLQWDCMDLQSAHVQFLETKNGEARGVPLHPRVVAALASLPHREGAVFRKPAKRGALVGEAYSRRRDGGGQIKTAFNAACRRAGIADFTPHDCRHTWATWHYRANRDLGALQKLGGWKSVSMVLRYAHTNTAEHAGSINNLPGVIMGE